ncbi:MAG TPA: hypothetical protein VD926_09055 [Acidimicrobiales bacterium]|nr:hypothetical protein [Acidimicrobiales bacterium]
MRDAAQKRAVQSWVNNRVRHNEGVTTIDRRCFEIGFDYGYDAGLREAAKVTERED